MSKEELIIALLKSKRSIAELFNNNFDDDKICDIKKILNRLRDVLPREYREGIKKNFTKLYDLTELVRILDKKAKCHQYDRDGPDYFGIRDI